MHEGNLSLEDTNKEKIQFASKLKDMGKCKIPFEKEKEFLITLKAKYFRQKVLNQNLNQQYLIQLNQQKNEPGNLDCDFFKKIAHYETNINTEISIKYFKYQNPAFFLNDLYKANKTKNEKIADYVNNALIDSRNAVNLKEIPENKNPDKVIDIVKEILNFIKQQLFYRLSYAFQILSKCFKDYQ